MKLYLVRHGQSTANKEKIIQGQFDAELSELGREQAEKIAQRLAQVPFEKIYSSNLKRASATAKAIRQFHKEVPYIEDKRLQEISRGEYAGRPEKDVEGWSSRTAQEKISFRPPGGENVDDQVERVRSFLDDLEKVDGNVLIVSHGGTKRALLHILLGYSYEYLFTEYRNQNTNLNIIDLSQRDPKHELESCIKHLEG